MPAVWIGWVGLIVWLGAMAILLPRWRLYQKDWNSNRWVIFAALVLATPVTSMLLGLRLPAWNALPLPGVTLEPGGLAVMIFSALPWVLAAGLLGPTPAAVLAVFSGLLLAYWDTHTIFTLVEMALLAALFAASVGQRYRTPTFRGLRHPLSAAVVLGLLYPAIFMLNTLLVAGGSLA
ncbi:MAG: hypothetical protein KJ638_07105, partial [Chloroflexi bacterium]|nr:hypothetical protein [Chloroflexota bacterium]